MTGHSDTKQTTDDESWVTVRRFSTLNDAYDHGLVVLAMGEDCRVEREPNDEAFILQTEETPSASLEKELDAFSEETIAAVHKSEIPEGRSYPAGWSWYFAWLTALVGAYYWQGSPSADVDRYVSSSVGLIADGEFWRPFTSLFLHADLPHLVGNLLVGLGFTVFVARSLGAWKAWTLILLCGALGNALNSWIKYPEEFYSLGASTAVFAALGLLSGSGVSQSWHMRPHWTWPKIAAPLLAGIVLLGMLGGSSDPRTDVLGHVCGFAVGLGAGVLAGHFEHKPTT
jgi:membrane associated rhomboid family serine protease